MPEPPDPNDSPQADPIESNPESDPNDGEAESDGPLRIYAEHLGVDFDAVVERAKQWVRENPLPPDLGPEPFNVGKPRPPADW